MYQRASVPHPLTRRPADKQSPARRQGKGFQGVPASVDWRESGAVGVVKDQSVCGSCWTFSASQAMSAAWWLQTGDFVSLAEQQLMDCAWDYGYNGGCDGGDPDLAMLYVIEAGGGAYSEKDWPYKGALLPLPHLRALTMYVHVSLAVASNRDGLRVSVVQRHRPGLNYDLG